LGLLPYVGFAALPSADRSNRASAYGGRAAPDDLLAQAGRGTIHSTETQAARLTFHATCGEDKEAAMATTAPDNGIIDKSSSHSVDHTVEKLKGILQAMGVTLFALVDHSGEAEKAGMKMRPTKLLIFGNPKGGTPVMLAAPSSAIDLPLKILVWEDDLGKVWLSYNSPSYLQGRHSIPPELVKNVSVAEGLAEQAAA
jgi:uncharacterized protein (DUF302 family)